MSLALRLQKVSAKNMDSRSKLVLKSKNTLKKGFKKPRKPFKLKNFKKLGIRQIVNFLVCFGAAFSLLWRYVQIYESSNYLRKLACEYETLLSQNQQTQFAIDRAIETVRLEKLAWERLGMIKPEKHQIFSVDMKKTDMSKNILASKQPPRGTFVTSVLLSIFR